MSAAKKFDAKANYAISDAKIATWHRGKRVVQHYKSGERLKGRVFERPDGML